MYEEMRRYRPNAPPANPPWGGDGTVAMSISTGAESKSNRSTGRDDDNMMIDEEDIEHVSDV